MLYVTVLGSFSYGYFRVVELLTCVCVISPGELRLDIPVLWITSVFPERIMLANRGFTTLGFTHFTLERDALAQ